MSLQAISHLGYTLDSSPACPSQYRVELKQKPPGGGIWAGYGKTPDAAAAAALADMEHYWANRFRAIWERL